MFSGRLFLSAALAASAALLTCSCEQIKKEQVWSGGVPELPEYPPLEHYRLTLQHEGGKTLPAGRPARLTFVLTNVDNKPVRIIEWYQNEPDNLRFFCQPWYPGSTEPDPEAWVELSGPVQQPALRYPLDLWPNNQVMISQDFTAAENMVVSPGAERRFFVKARLNLNSVDVESPVSAIAVQYAPPLPVEPAASAEQPAPAVPEAPQPAEAAK